MLIISASPHSQGLSREIYEHCLRSLGESSAVTEIDLYRLGFDPVLRQQEIDDAYSHRLLSKEIQLLQQQLRDAEGWIFIFPVWWQSVPAVLKGFFDRVFTPGFAFSFSHGRPVGLLPGKRVLLIYTMDAGWWTYRMTYRSLLSNYFRKGFFGFFGIKDVRELPVFRARKITKERKEKLFQRIDHMVKKMKP